MSQRQKLRITGSLKLSSDRESRIALLVDTLGRTGPYTTARLSQCLVAGFEFIGNGNAKTDKSKTQTACAYE